LLRKPWAPLGAFHTPIRACGANRPLTQGALTAGDPETRSEARSAVRGR
jgi:hypothetical protein